MGSAIAVPSVVVNIVALPQRYIEHIIEVPLEFEDIPTDNELDSFQINVEASCNVHVPVGKALLVQPPTPASLNISIADFERIGLQVDVNFAPLDRRGCDDNLVVESFPVVPKNLYRQVHVDDLYRESLVNIHWKEAVLDFCRKAEINLTASGA